MSGKYFVVMACRNTERAQRVAEELDFPKNSFVTMKLELGSYHKAPRTVRTSSIEGTRICAGPHTQKQGVGTFFLGPCVCFVHFTSLTLSLFLSSYRLASVRSFVFNLKVFKATRPLDALVCNAAVYLPADPEPRFTEDGFEMSMGVNHLGHFLLTQLLIPDIRRAKNQRGRVVIVGSITGNSNTIGGGLVYPRADLGDLSGMRKGAGSEMAASTTCAEPCFRDTRNTTRRGVSLFLLSSVGEIRALSSR